MSTSVGICHPLLLSYLLLWVHMHAHWLDSLLSYVLFEFYRPAEKFLPLPLPWVVAKSQVGWFIQSTLPIKNH